MKRAEWLTHGVGLVLVFFVLLLVWRGEVIMLPPYYETGMGLFREAEFLSATNFDYMALRYDEPVGNDGGAYCYMTSVLPTLVAVLMQTTPSPGIVFLICHLLWFLAGAIIAAGVSGLTRSQLGVPASIGLALAVITTPLLVVQVELMSMDVPMTALGILAVWALVRGRYGWSAVAGFAAFAAKPTGLIVTLASLIYLTLGLLVRRSDSAERRIILRGLCYHAVALTAEVGIYAWGGIHNRLQRIGFIESFIYHFWIICPDVSVLILMVAVGGVVFAIREVVRCRQKGQGVIVSLAESAWTTEAVLLMAVMIVCALLAAMILYAGVFVIRYLTLVIPFLFMAASLLIFRWRIAIWIVVIPYAWAAFNVMNAYGWAFPEHPSDLRHCSILERSREYLPDLRASIEAMKAIELQAGSDPVVAGYPFNYYLSFPSLGYVEKPLAGYAAMPLPGTQFQEADALLTDLPSQVVAVSINNPSHRQGQITISPPEFADEILYEDPLPSPLTVYRTSAMGASGEETTQEIIHRFYAGTDAVNLTGMLRVQRSWRLVNRGRIDLAIQLLKTSIENDPDDLDLRLELAELLIIDGKYEESLEQSGAAIARSHSKNLAAFAQAQYYVGLVALAQGRVEEAEQSLNRTLGLLPNHTQALYQMGICQLTRRDLSQASPFLQRVIELDPRHSEAHFHLALIAIAWGDIATGEAHLRRVLEIYPGHNQARAKLAELQSQRQQPSAYAPTRSIE